MSTGIASQEKLSELEDNDAEQERTINGLKDQVNNYKPIVIDGNVTNAADEEDLTSENGLLKIKNRSSLNGMGYVILRKNKSFVEQVTQSNTIYEIRYDFENVGSVSLPSNCILKFVGGHILSGSIVFDNTLIDSDKVESILPVSCSGSLLNDVIYPEWFCNSDNYTSAIQTCTDLATRNGAIIKFTGERYLVNGGKIIMKPNVSYVSDCKSVIFTQDHKGYHAIFFSGQPYPNADNVTFKGLVFDQSAEVDAVYSGEHPSMMCILTYTSQNLLVEDCKFINVGTNCVVVNGNRCHNSKILNNEFIFMRIQDASGNPINYDNSVVYITDSLHTIEGNIIVNDGTPENRSRGGIETHGFLGSVSGNTISNCNNAINIVEVAIQRPDNLTPNRLISNNKVFNCGCFCRFWPVTNYNPIENIVISNNSLQDVDCVINMHAAGDQAGMIKNISVVNNVCVGKHKIYTSDNILTYYNDVAIAIFTYASVEKLDISNNVFKDFPNSILAGSPWKQDGEEKRKEVYFRNNICYNCMNFELSEEIDKTSLNYISSVALFRSGQWMDVTIENNTFEIDSLNRNGLFAFMNSSPYGYFNAIIKNNVQPKGQALYITYPSGVYSIITDMDNLQNSRRISGEKVLCNPSVHEKLYVGDIIMTDRKSFVVTENGHIDSIVPNISLSDIRVRYETINFLQLSGIGSTHFNVGDWIHIKTASGTVREFTGYVMQTLQDKCYVYFTGVTPSFFGSTDPVTLSFLKYWKASTIENIGRLNVIASTSVAGELGDFAYCTALSSFVLHNGTNWVDVNGYTALATHGATSAIPTRDQGLSTYDYGKTFFNYDTKQLLVWDSVAWRNPDGAPKDMRRLRGTSANRPQLSSAEYGTIYYDATLRKMILWDGSSWVNMDGSPLT